MSDLSLTFTEEERAFLAALLETALKSALVEEHRTRTLSLREHLVHNEDLIAGVLKKFNAVPV